MASSYISISKVSLIFTLSSSNKNLGAPTFYMFILNGLSDPKTSETPSTKPSRVVEVKSIGKPFALAEV